MDFSLRVFAIPPLSIPPTDNKTSEKMPNNNKIK